MTIIDSWGGLGSNSYSNYTNATSVITTQVVGSVSAWTSATTAQAEAALIQATRQIDALQYIGYRYNSEQTLEFPRALNRDFPWGYTQTTTILGDTFQVRMRYQVECAVALQALYLLKNGGTPAAIQRQQQGVQSWSEQLGPMSQSANYGSATGAVRNPERTLSPEVLTMLADYRTSRQIYRA